MSKRGKRREGGRGDAIKATPGGKSEVLVHDLL